MDDAKEFKSIGNDQASLVGKPQCHMLELE
jgi:hypothetical protein